MTEFDKLEQQYVEIDSQYAQLEFNAARRGWSKKEESLQAKRKQNDEAYFLFMFSRLEDRIRQESSKLIIKMQGSPRSYRTVSAWITLPPNPEDDIPFKRRLALLIQKHTTDYQMICKYYDHRNSIAHGGHFVSNIAMPSSILEFKRLNRLLQA